MRPVFLFVCLLIFVSATEAQQTNYDASLIPKELLPYASAIIRNQQETVEVKSADNVVRHLKRAITVLNKNGDNIAHMVIFYNSNIAVKNIKGVVYNEFGKVVKKFTERDFLDESAISDYSLFEDARVKHYIPSITEYPYTIEYEYEVRNKQSLDLDGWSPNPEPNLAVEKSSFTFICKPDFKIRYKEINLPGKVVLGTNGDGEKTYTWEISNMKAFREEPYSPDWRKFLTRVVIAPEKFSYAGIGGSFTNWKDLGKWEYDKLLANRDGLSDETRKHITDITKDIIDPKHKAKKIYEYMQQKTHYISVQVGIGGYQPFLASDVDKQNYGDCKALVNYMHSLLEAVNINSYYCVVQAGREHTVGLMNDFASMDQGNHIILCLPFKNDTTWLECTSQSIPFGFLGDFTDDRNVLACTPDGGILMHTPKYTTRQNLRKRNASFVLNDAGELDGTMETEFKGTEYDARNYEIQEAPAERVKEIKKRYPINNLDVEKLTYRQDKSQQPVTTESIKLKARDYGALNNGKIYFLVNPVSRIGQAPRQLRTRFTDVDIDRGYTLEDEVTYTLPKGYHLDSDPLKVHIEKPFGNFDATTTVNGDQLVYKREFVIKDGTYSKDTYQALVDFYQDVSDADNYNAALAKN